MIQVLLNAASHDATQVESIQGRRNRKQAFPRRSPSKDDVQPGRVFTVAFSPNGSQMADNQLRRQNQHDTTSLPSGAPRHGSDPDTVSLCTGHHLMSGSSADQLGTDINGGAIHPGRSFGNNRHGSLKSLKGTVHSMMSATDTDPSAEHISLADQYLDTMVMDDRWRALCLEAIRAKHQRQRLLKRADMKSTRQSRSSNTPVRPRRGASNLIRKVNATGKKLESTPPTPPISPRVAHRNDPSPCSTRSDSGFISSSPSPAPPAHLRLRSTRNCPVVNAPATISIDVSPSMIGRTCLSCGSSNTTCWRRTLGGIICNSCGLRYKKCGIICADPKCRYIPTRSEIRDMKHQGVRSGQCYACKGDCIAR